VFYLSTFFKRFSSKTEKNGGDFLKIAILFMVFLVFSAMTIGAVSIALLAPLPVRTGQMRAVIYDVVSNGTEPNGDPVGGGGGAPR